MRRLLRWVKRIALGGLALAVLAIGAALIALHTDWGRERIRRIAAAQLASAFPGGVRIGRLEGSVLGELVARDVEIRAADGSLYARAGALRIELALAPLLGNTAELERVVADDVELYPMRAIAPPKPEPEAQGSASAWSVELPEIELHRARLVIEAAPQVVTLEDLDLVAQVSIPAGAPIAASGRLRGTWRERGALVEGSAAATVDGALVTLPRLDVRVGGIAVRGTDVVVDPAHPTGALQLDAPASAVARLVPEVALPGDARLAVTASRAASGELALELSGGVGASRVTGKLFADVAASRVRGVVTAKDVALRELTRGARDGAGTAIVAFVADRGRIRGTAIASGGVEPRLAGDAVVSFDAALDPARGADAGLDALAAGAGLVLAAGADGSSVRGFTRLSRRADGALAIDAGQLAMETPDMSGIAGEAAPVRGRLAVTAALGGTADPLDVTVRGTLDGAGVAYGEPRADAITARRLHARFRGAAKGSLARATGEVAGEIRGVADAGVPRGDADLRATLRPDRTIAAWIQARPAAAPVVVAASATITPGTSGASGAPTIIALGDHAITLASGERWSGRGGRVVIGPARVVLERLRTANSHGGHLDVGATFDPATQRLAVALEASSVAAASIDPAYRGVASGAIRLTRRGARWDGTVALDGRGLAFAPDATPLDAELRVKVAGRRVVLESAARTEALGGVRFDLDVDGPADLTDLDGWRLLPRAAVRSARLGVDHASLEAAAVPTGGVVDGTVYIAGADTTGTVQIRGVRTPLGEASGDITFRPEANSELGATSTVRVAGLGDADVSARIAFPRQPFDPEAWQRLGRGALSHLGASLSDIAIDPDRLAALGIDAPYRGVADLAIGIADGATSAAVELDLTGVSGGPIAQPIDVHVSATIDPSAGTRVRGNVQDTREPERTMLASFAAEVPSFDIDRWIAAPEQARTAPIAGGLITVPGVPIDGGPRPASPLSAPALLAVLGRDDLAAGTILGTISIGGTLGAPTAEAHVELSRLLSARRVPGKPAPRPTDLAIDARWDGASGRVALRGASGGGTLVARAEGAPADLSKIAGSLTATDFDLAPLAAFLPDALRAVEGKLGASLTARGLDSIDKLRGSLAVAQAVVPLHPMLGTLRDGTAHAKIDDRGIDLGVEGALGSGKVSFAARSAGHALAQIEATGKLHGVSPLGEWEPVIDAEVDASLRRRATDQWTGAIKVRNATAVLPPARSDLGDPDAPRDLLFVEDGPIAPPRFALGGRPPERPWLVADVELLPMKLKAEELFDTRGQISGSLQLEVGDTIGLVGSLEVEDGIIGDLFGRRYTATGRATFDGTLEPKVDLALQHKFPELVLTVLLQGEPTTIVPDFQSDPPTYTRDQLAGFFIGGEPGGDPSQQTQNAATGAGAAVLSSTLGARIRKRLPIKVEQLGCDPGNVASAASCTVGRWFGENLFVAFKRRFVAEENKSINANEVQGQYYLRRNLFLEMAGGDAGIGGLDLLWRRRW